MKEWSELEEHYQEMRQKDPRAAEEFKKKMTSRFQKTVEALEEEGAAEKRQLISMHQQRVMSIINMRKKTAMDCFTHALDATPPKAKRIEKCLKKLLRALDKDRSHTLHHYKHLLNSNLKQALREKDAMLEHLENLIHMSNQSIQMLERIPGLSEKLRDRMVAFWHNLRGTPVDEPITKEAELEILDRYEEEVAQKQQEKEQQKMLEDERREELRELQEERKRLQANQKNGKLNRDFDPESMEDEHDEQNIRDHGSQESGAGHTLVAPTSTLSVISEEMAPHNSLPTPKVSHVQNQVFHHNEVVSCSLLIVLAF